MPSETDDEIARRIAAEERLRADIARRINPPSSGQTWINADAKWIIAAILIPLMTFVYGWRQERIAQIAAQSEQRIATERLDREVVVGDARNDVAAMTALIPALASQDEKTAGIALAVLSRLRDAQRNRSAELAALFDEQLERIKALQNSKDPAEMNRGARQLEVVRIVEGNTQQTNAETVSVVPPAKAAEAAEFRPSRVYIQIFDVGQMADAEVARELLRNQGAPVPRIENVGDRLKPGTLPGWEIRYFGDADLGAATWVKSRLGTGGFDKFKVVKTRATGNVPAGQVECWWPNRPGNR